MTLDPSAHGGIPRRTPQFELGGVSAPLFAMILVCVMASMMMIFNPLLVDSLRRTHGASFESEIALIASADQTGMFFGAIAALWAVPRFNRRLLAVLGLGLLILGDLGSISASDISNMLYAIRILAGVGSGLAMGVAYAGLGASRVPERSFALYGLLQTAVGSTAIYALSTMDLKVGPSVVYACSLGLAIIGLIAAFYVDATPSVRNRSTRIPRDRAAIWALGPLTAISYLLFGVSGTGLWANAESIGTSLGLAHQMSAVAISFSLLGSVAGAFVVMLTGKRWGRIRPTILISCVYLAGIVLLLMTPGYWGFLAALAAIQFGTNLGSHAFGAISEADSVGRLSIIYLLSLKAGFGLGPLAASLFIVGTDYHALIVAALLLSAVVCSLILLTLRVALYDKKVSPLVT